MKVAIGGFLHKTNTSPDCKLKLLHGEQLIGELKNSNLPIARFIEVAQQLTIGTVPTTWCEINGKIEDYVCNKIIEAINYQLTDSLPLDGVYLDFNRYASNDNDLLGEIIFQIRQEIGDELPIIVSIDSQVKTSKKMISNSTIILSDFTEPNCLGQHVAKLFFKLLSNSIRFNYKAFKRIYNCQGFTLPKITNHSHSQICITKDNHGINILSYGNSLNDTIAAIESITGEIN